MVHRLSNRKSAATVKFEIWEIPSTARRHQKPAPFGKPPVRDCVSGFCDFCAAQPPKTIPRPKSHLHELDHTRTRMEGTTRMRRCFGDGVETRQLSPPKSETTLAACELWTQIRSLRISLQASPLTPTLLAEPILPRTLKTPRTRSPKTRKDVPKAPDILTSERNPLTLKPTSLNKPPKSCEKFPPKPAQFR